MLSSWMRRGAAILAGAAALVALSVSSPMAASADDCHDNGQGGVVCDVVVEVPGTPGGGGTPGKGPAGFTPGPTSCMYTPEGGEPKEVPCSRDGGSWSNADQCYWTLDDPQRPAPTGLDDSVGAWYSCVPFEACSGRGCTFDVSLWLESPPPGITRYTPAQAAGMLARTFELNPIQMGMAPSEKVHSDDPAGTAPYRRTWVGIPVWLWVDEPTESTWGPISRTATYGGVTVTGTAKVQSLVWDSGDGQTVSCGAGTFFDLDYWADRAVVDSPTCGFRYQHQSDGGTFTVTATSRWAVEWTGGGESGRIQLPTTSTSTQVRVGELQSVNVSQEGDTFGG